MAEQGGTVTLSLLVPADKMALIRQAAASQSTDKRPVTVEAFVLRAATRAAEEEMIAHEPFAI